MVTDDRSRGQLILVAAIALAFIVIGVVVVFNGVLYTQTISSSSTSVSSSDAQVSEYELEQGIQGVIQRENLDGPDPGAAVEQFGNNYSERKAASGAAVVDLEFKSGGDDGQSATSDIQENDSVDLGEREIGHFTMNVIDISDEDIEVSARNNVNDRSVTIGENAGELTIERDGSETCTVEYDEGIKFDFVSGEVAAEGGSDCSVNIIESGIEYDDIEFDAFSDAEADFSLVTEGGEEIDELEDQTTVHWTADVTVSYHSSDVSYERPETIDVYGDRE